LTSVSIPRSIKGAETKLAELGEIATATEWHRAAIVAAFVQIGRGHGGRKETPNSGSLESAVAFSRRGIIGLTSDTTVAMYARAWLDLFPRPEPGRKVTLPDLDWPPTRTGTDGYSSEDGAAKTVERIVEKHGAVALAAAVKSSPKVAEAAAQALVEKGDVAALSQATAAASRNRQVERNRARREEGLGKGRTVEDKPKAFTPDVMAFLQVKGLSDALRSLVTTFPNEWAALSEDAKSDDFIGVCEETFDKIEIALANCRNIVSGGVSDKAIMQLLDGAS
jgi:hypothetical protein